MSQTAQATVYNTNKIKKDLSVVENGIGTVAERYADVLKTTDEGRNIIEQLSQEIDYDLSKVMSKMKKKKSSNQLNLNASIVGLIREPSEIIQTNTVGSSSQSNQCIYQYRSIQSVSVLNTFGRISDEAENSVINNILAIYLYHFVQLPHLFITRLPYSAVGTGCSHELSIPMGQRSKNKESRNGRKSGPFQKCALVQWAGYATNACLGHQFEPRSRLARRATGSRRISVRTTVSAHCSHQRTCTTHHTATTRLGIASANTGRHHRSAAAGNGFLRNKYVEYAGSG
ncbi:MAG: hypothetical protein EZS28_051375, partial [Streblomastix strix]